MCFVPIIPSLQEVSHHLYLPYFHCGTEDPKTESIFCACSVNSEQHKPPPKLLDVYCYCSNVECGHTLVMNVSFSHTISPSALSGQGRIKELMDALPPDERQKALELLLAAKESR